MEIIKITKIKKQKNYKTKEFTKKNKNKGGMKGYEEFKRK